MRLFYYTSTIKRPGEKYILHGVFGWDFLNGVFAYALGSEDTILITFSFLFYLLGFFSIYEIGYYENDNYALSRESYPKINVNRGDSSYKFDATLAWIRGVVLLSVGSLIQTLSAVEDISVIGLTEFKIFMRNWAASLAFVLVTRLTFRIFNSLSPRSRFIPMLGLQVERTLGYALMLPISPVGIVLCLSHSFARWFPYVLYRCGYQREAFPIHIGALFLFACFTGVFVALQRSLKIDISFDSQFWAILVYLCLRAAKQLRDFRSAKH